MSGERIILFVREYPAVCAVVLFVALTAAILSGLSLLMLRSGLSVKPMLFIAGFFALVAGPQGVVHLLDALLRPQTAAATGSRHAPTTRSSLDDDAFFASLFGDAIDPQLVTDARVGLAAIVGEADAARIGYTTRGEAILGVRLPSSEAAHAAQARAMAGFGIEGDPSADTIARRFGGSGEWTRMIVLGTDLCAWTAPSREAAVRLSERSLQALGADEPDPTQAASALRASNDRTPLSRRLTARPLLMTLFLSVNLCAATLWFFRGSAWAARVPPRIDAPLLDLTALRQRIVASGAGDSLRRVVEEADGSITVEWSTADQRWIDLAGLHQINEIQRLVLRPDPQTRSVIVEEFTRRYDRSVGVAGVTFAWQAVRGIQFFRLEHSTRLGYAVDGEAKGLEAIAITIDGQALKAPLIATITDAGWAWQPVVWQFDREGWGAWLRFLMPAGA